MLVVCDYCDKEFEKRAADVSRTKHNYCSKPCTGAGKQKITADGFFGWCVKSESCWEWKGRRDKNGYGVKRFEGKPQMAHRVSYRLSVGEIPKGMCVLHTCDNPCCVNPAHLWLGTHKENMDDMTKKGRRYKK